MSNPAYSKENRFAINHLIALLRAFVSQTNHEFWPDDLSLRNAEIFDPAQLHSSGRVTDTYLLALATRRKGRLVTLDQGISISAVKHAKPKNLTHI
jgi:predicted nucleic acid-binding protein